MRSVFITHLPGVAPRSKAQALNIADGAAGVAASLALAVALASGLMAQNPAEPAESTPARAEESRSTVALPTREVMIAGYAGVPYHYPSDVAVKKPGTQDFTVKDVAWDGQPFKNPIYYGARIVRWREGGQTGAMIDFTHSKALARLDEVKEFSGTLDGQPAPQSAKLRDVFKRLEATHGHNMLTLNGLVRLPAFGLRLYPYVGLGAGIALPHSEVEMRKDPSRTYEYQYTGPVAQTLVGIEFRAPRMSYFLEYKFTFADYAMPLTFQDGSLLIFDLWRQLKRWWSGEAPPGGYLTTQFASHQVVGGLGARFGASAASAGK